MKTGISKKKKMMQMIKGKVSEVILYFLYGGFYQLYKKDSRIREEVDSWENGMTYCLKCSADGPQLFIRKNRNGLQRLNPVIQKTYDTCFEFKSLDEAFLVLTGRQGVAGAYAAHGFLLYGDIGTAMSFSRSIDLVEAYLFPQFMTKHILKEIPEKQVSTLAVYASVLGGILTGNYHYAQQPKATYTMKSSPAQQA